MGLFALSQLPLRSMDRRVARRGKEERTKRTLRLRKGLFFVVRAVQVDEAPSLGSKRTQEVSPAATKRAGSKAFDWIRR